MEMFPPIKVVDLFCGIGGLSHGLVMENLLVTAGFDIDGSCKYPFEENNNAQFVQKDIREVTSDEVNGYFGDAKIRILVGCAPCQPFSTYAVKHSSKQDVEEAKDGKWSLLNEFARLIEEVKPEIVSMENVPGIAKHDKSQVFKNFLKVLASNGYEVDYKIVYCPDYGVPQQRKRLVLLASRLGKISIIQETHSPSTYRTVKDAIGHLEPIQSGEVCSTDSIHRSVRLSDINLERIRQSKPGGTWRDWEDRLVLDCHRKPTGKSYASVYGRMKWEEPAPTMTTFCTGIGNGRFGHPEQDRAISLREAALIQTFPQSYKFVADESNVSMAAVSTHIGNAVPVRLGQVIAQSIKFHLKDFGDNGY